MRVYTRQQGFGILTQTFIIEERKKFRNSEREKVMKVDLLNVIQAREKYYKILLY